MTHLHADFLNPWVELPRTLQAKGAQGYKLEKMSNFSMRDIWVIKFHNASKLNILVGLSKLTYW